MSDFFYSASYWCSICCKAPRGSRIWRGPWVHYQIFHPVIMDPLLEVPDAQRKTPKASREIGNVHRRSWKNVVYIRPISLYRQSIGQIRCCRFHRLRPRPLYNNKTAFHDTDILARTSDMRDSPKLFLWQAERGSRPTRRMSVSWNAAFTPHLFLNVCVHLEYFPVAGALCSSGALFHWTACSYATLQHKWIRNATTQIAFVFVPRNVTK